MTAPIVPFRKFQLPVFRDRTTGIVILHWSRQIGKSYDLAAWSVDRLLAKLKKNDSWLITVLSNSKDNGAEFALKCAAVCNSYGVAAETIDESPDLKYENMRTEIRITKGKRIGRIKVLAANPRTARGFSGDLVLDEFAFHEDSNAIWEAAEPILSSNPEFLCRIASTGNGRHNMFYRMASGDGPSDGTFFQSAAGFTVSRVTRSAAWRMGLKIYDSNTRKPITPEQARAQSLDKRAYDQNYECSFENENMALLTHELISAAERDGVTIDDQAWTQASIARMARAAGRLEAGQDFARNKDLSVMAVIERDGVMRRIIAMLRMQNMRSPDQRRQLDIVVNMPRFARMDIDMTGNGLGHVEYAQDFHPGKQIYGVNFATTEALNEYLKIEGRKEEKAKVTEIMATNLVGVFEARQIEIPNDPSLRESLMKPERIVSPGGKVTIAGSRDAAGHADEFWAIALAIRAGEQGVNTVCQAFEFSHISQTLDHRAERFVEA